MANNNNGIKIKEQILRAKQKLKTIGIGTAFAAAAALPAKAAAQTERVYDPETQKMSVVVDTIRLGMTVTNTSSPKKDFRFFDYSPARSFLDMKDPIRDSMVNAEGLSPLMYFLDLDRNVIDNQSRFEWSHKAAVDNNGLFLLVLKDAIVKKSENNYEYNTDAIYDNYMNLGKKFFPALHNNNNDTVSIMVYSVGFLEQILFVSFNQNARPVLGNMIIDAKTRDVLISEDIDYGGKEVMDVLLYQHVADKKNEVRFYNNGTEQILRKNSKGDIFIRKVADVNNIEHILLKLDANQR